jgi:hypothetical protein
MVTEVVVVMSPIEEYIRSNDEKINDIKKKVFLQLVTLLSGWRAPL